MLKKRLTKIAALCIASTLLLAGCSSGSTKSSPNPDSEKDSAAAAPIVLKFSDVNAEQSPAGIFCLKFKELVEERTEGRVQIENYFGGTLTANNIEGTQTGIADLSQHDVSEVTDLCAALSILEAPFLFDSEEELFKVTAPESPIMDRLNEELSGTGVRLLATYSWGNQNLLTTSKPVYCEEDLKGMKIRVIPSQIFMETMSAMGATPSPMGWSEVVTSLITKMIDGTGMCGGCRLTVGGETKFACVDGPDFDGQLVDWDLAVKRNQMYHDFEVHKHEEVCNLFKQEVK